MDTYSRNTFHKGILKLASCTHHGLSVKNVSCYPRIQLNDLLVGHSPQSEKHLCKRSVLSSQDKAE